jgi:hypothetical protein
MPPTNMNLLLVEGKGEQYSIPELMDAYTVWGDKPKDWVVQIKEMNGIETILKRGVISAESKTPGLRALGVIVDADDKFVVRWERLKTLCRDISDSIPDDLPPQGMIHITPKGLRIGVWIMPDNSSHGMMETFLARLLSPECAPIWHFARSSCVDVSRHEHSHNAAHRDKAEIHTYLAWIEPPGQTLPEAIISRAINAKLPLARQFVSWMIDLFQLNLRQELTGLPSADSSTRAST